MKRYEILLARANMLLQIEDNNGYSVEFVDDYRNAWVNNENISANLVPYTKLKLFDAVLNAKKNTVEKSINAIYEVYADFDKEQYIKVFSLLRKSKEGALPLEDINYLKSQTFIDPYITLLVKTITLQNLTYLNADKIDVIRELVQDVDNAIKECEEVSDNLGREDLYVNIQ